MADTTSTPTPTAGNGTSEGTNYLTIALVVGIPCSVIILALIILISIMLYLTCKCRSHNEEEVYIRRRFQGISLEQQRQSKMKKKRTVAERRESGVSGNFNIQISRSPSTLSAAARANPFGLQEWQIRMYGGSGPGNRSQGGDEGSPDTEETDISGDEIFHRRSNPTGAINPLMVVQGQNYDPGYDTPPQRKNLSHKHSDPPTHSHNHPSNTSHNSHLHTTPFSKMAAHSRAQKFQLGSEEQENEDPESSSDDSMNPYDS